MDALFKKREEMAPTLQFRTFAVGDSPSTVPGNAITCYYAATVPDHVLDNWLGEVAALPARKRKNWKSVAMNAYGIRCQVRYSEIAVPISPISSSHFQQRMSLLEAQEAGLPRGTWFPVQSLSQRDEAHRFTEGLGGRQLCGETVLNTDDATHEARLCEHISANATGNHCPRPKRIGVPTRPGEPVRG